jgi:manganese/iron transport system permease protein
VAAFQYGLLALLALTTVIALKAVGVVLVMALLVTPAATAQLLVQRLPLMMALGSLVGVTSTVIGLYIAYYADVSASAAIVLTVTGFFALALLFSPAQGLLWQLRPGQETAKAGGQE